MFGLAKGEYCCSWTNYCDRRVQKNFRRTLFKVNNVQVTTITKSKSVSFSFLSRPTDPVLLLIFYLQQEIKVEWPKGNVN